MKTTGIDHHREDRLALAGHIATQGNFALLDVSVEDELLEFMAPGDIDALWGLVANGCEPGPGAGIARKNVRATGLNSLQ